MPIYLDTSLRRNIISISVNEKITIEINIACSLLMFVSTNIEMVDKTNANNKIVLFASCLTSCLLNKKTIRVNRPEKPQFIEMQINTPTNTTMLFQVIYSSYFFASLMILNSCPLDASSVNNEANANWADTSAAMIGPLV